MQISLTKKLSKAIGIKPGEVDESVNPLFCWTANWINTFSDRKEDMVVLVNQANRFTISIYGIKYNQFKNLDAKILAAIKHTFLSMNFNPDLVEDYMIQAGKITYAVNRDPKMTACLNQQGIDVAGVVGRTINKTERELKFIDTLGGVVSRRYVNYSKNPGAAFVPADEMIKDLAGLTGKPVYKYRAFELLVTLDLDAYKATRRLIVPSNIKLHELHEVLQEAFGWDDYHLYDFIAYDEDPDEPIARLVPDEGSLDYDNTAMLLYDRDLSDYLPDHKLVYTYDMGDNWEHQIEVIRIIDYHNEDSPFLLEAHGQTPPEDVGGVGGFLHFRKIMLDPEHPEYSRLKEWSRYWTPDLSEWQNHPRVLRQH